MTDDIPFADSVKVTVGHVYAAEQIDDDVEVAGRVQIVAYHADGTEFYRDENENIFTDGGRDWLHAQGWVNDAGGTNGSNFIGLSSDTGGVAATDTVLAGEITTGGLVRAQAVTRTHNPNTNTTILSQRFDATATHTNVQKAGLFNLLTGGILTNETTFSPVTLHWSEYVRINWTVTLG